ncbi:hypothetical protein [Paenibacillus nuruki]|nr:hypothetical protein [Paenibacillus nuruki]
MIDNSESSGEIVLEIIENKIVYRSAEMPKWVKDIEPHLKN